MKGALVLLVLLATCYFLQAKRLHPESHYQQYYANLVGGETEVVLGNRTRCDIVTATHAIEVDFADSFQILRYDTRGHGQFDAPKGAYALEAQGKLSEAKKAK